MGRPFSSNTRSSEQAKAWVLFAQHLILSNPAIDSLTLH